MKQKYYYKGVCVWGCELGGAGIHSASSERVTLQQNLRKSN